MAAPPRIEWREEIGRDTGFLRSFFVKWKTLGIGIGILTIVISGMVVALMKLRPHDSGWGRGPLKVAERYFYMARIEALAETWQNMALHAEQDQSGRLIDGPVTYLAVDTKQPRMWLESEGRIVPMCQVQLPRRLKWKLYRFTPAGRDELPSLGRFRIHGVFSDRQPQEMVYLVGTRGRQEQIAAWLAPNDSHTDYGGSVHIPSVQWNSPPPQPLDVQRYASIVVTDTEYEVARAYFPPAGHESPRPPKALAERAAWERVEQTLYQEIEKQVLCKGAELEYLRVTVGPDHTAAFAELRVKRNERVRSFQRRALSTEVHLQIDQLHDDIWYARSTPPLLRHSRSDFSLNLEFLVSAADPISVEDQITLLAEGRQRQQAAPTP